MDYKLNITSITPAWGCCNYRFCVAVGDMPCGDLKKWRYISETLEKWFGSCEYFWNGVWLVCKK